MADPFTAMLGFGMMAGGTALEASSQLREGKEAAKEGKYAQMAAERRAKITERATLDEQQRLRESGKRLKAKQIVDIAAGGGRLTGTSLKAIVQSAANVEHDIAKVGQSGMYEAEDIRYQGKVARYKGRMARYGSRIRAATTIGKSAGQMLLFSHLLKAMPKTEVPLGKKGSIGSLRGRNISMGNRPWAGLNTSNYSYLGKVNA